jgi:hypothetical protein
MSRANRILVLVLPVCILGFSGPFLLGSPIGEAVWFVLVAASGVLFARTDRSGGVPTIPNRPWRRWTSALAVFGGLGALGLVFLLAGAAGGIGEAAGIVVGVMLGSYAIYVIIQYIARPTGDSASQRR